MIKDLTIEAETKVCDTHFYIVVAELRINSIGISNALHLYIIQMCVHYGNVIK